MLQDIYTQQDVHAHLMLVILVLVTIGLQTCFGLVGALSGCDDVVASLLIGHKFVFVTKKK